MCRFTAGLTRGCDSVWQACANTVEWCWQGDYLLVLKNKAGLQWLCKPLSVLRARLLTHLAQRTYLQCCDNLLHACLTEHLLPTLGSASCCANIAPSPPSEHTQGCGVPLQWAARRSGRLPLAGSPCWLFFPVDNNDKEGFWEGEKCREPSLVIGQKNKHKTVMSSQCPARSCWVISWVWL